jgi:hypothetical protein
VFTAVREAIAASRVERGKPKRGLCCAFCPGVFWASTGALGHRLSAFLFLNFYRDFQVKNIES